MIKKPRVDNISRILKNIWSEKSISRIEISKTLGLNKSTITDIVSELLKKGIVLETEEGSASPQGGRKPVYIEMDKNYGCIVGIEVTAEDYTAVAVDLSGNILLSEKVKDDSRNINFKTRIKSIISQFSNKLELKKINILGIGIGMSGIIDAKAGIIKGSITLNINEAYNFTEQIGKDIGVPVFVDNDANCCAWGELAFNRSERLKNFIFTLIEFHPSKVKEVYENVSVGFGIVINGTVHYGSDNTAGEFRSIFCSDNDNNQFVSTAEDLKIEDGIERLNQFISELSKHLALFVNTFNFRNIFLGGDIEEYKNLITPVLQKNINRNWMYPSDVNCDIRFSSLSNKSVAYGAAGMATQRLFDEPGLLFV